jgi:hypothetical protein
MPARPHRAPRGPGPMPNEAEEIETELCLEDCADHVVAEGESSST